MNLTKIFKYEILNILRNRWVFVYSAFLLGLTIVFLRISGDFSKTILSLSTVLNILIPLVSILFSVVYWYYSDRFTELLLTQPVLRRSILMARWGSLSLSLCACIAVGISLPLIFTGGMSTGLMLLLVTSFFLTFVFVTLGLWIAVGLLDRMKGIGLSLGVWLYFSLIHDGVLLLFLLAFREYPIDGFAAALGSMNPIGLVRVIHLVHYDISLLLSFSGMLVRNLLTQTLGKVLALIICSVWMFLPIYFTQRKFLKRDY